MYGVDKKKGQYPADSRQKRLLFSRCRGLQGRQEILRVKVPRKHSTAMPSMTKEKTNFMNAIVTRLSILIIGLLLGICMLTACTASEKAANDPVSSAGGAEQSKTTADNRPGESKSASKEILYDFRKTNDYKTQTFPAAETDAVVKYLFGETSSKIEIRNRLSGSFTKLGAKETLYYLTGCKDDENGQFTTDCPHSSWNSDGWIAIFDGTTPVAKLNEPLGSNVIKVTDINEDGKNEILSVADYGQSGTYSASVSLGQLSDGKYEVVKGSSALYGWNCAFGGDKKDSELSARATVISYVPTTDGKVPEFIKEYYRGQCKDGEVDEFSWKTTTKEDFDEFIDSIS